MISRILTAIEQFLCHHNTIICREEGRMSVVCMKCGWESCGVQIDAKN